MPKFGIILLIIFFITFLPAFAINNKAIKADADYIAFNPEKTIFIANGNATVSIKGLEIQGGTICVDVLNSRLVASNEVLLKSDSGELTCDSISINLNDKSAYILQNNKGEIKAQLDTSNFEFIKFLDEFPEGSFYIENILDASLCVTGNELIIHPNETAQIKPAAFWIEGSHSVDFPFYSFTLGSGASYIKPRVSYTDLGATVDLPVILSLQENSISITHLKYNKDLGVSFSIEHRMQLADNASAVFYLEDLNSDEYRTAKMVYRQQFSPTTDANLNVEWQNDQDLDLFFNFSHRFSHSIINFNMQTDYIKSDLIQDLPTTFDLQWKQNPTKLFNSPVLYSFSGGVSLISDTFSPEESTWSKNIGLRLTHKPLMIGKTSSVVFGVGDDQHWLSSGETRNYLFANMTLRLGSRISIDSNINRDSFIFYNGRNITNTTANISLNTRFTKDFSGRLTYYFRDYNYLTTFNRFDPVEISTLDNQLGAFVTYNKSQNFQLGLGTTYDLNLSRIRSAQGNMRFKIGKYFFLTLRPYYDFIDKTNNFNFQIDPIFAR